MGHGHHHHQRQKRDLRDNVDQVVDELVHSAGDKIQRAETYVKTVYQTLTPDFTGEIAGYSTQGQDTSLATQAAPSPTQDQETTPTNDTQTTETEAPNSITSPVATSLDPTLNVAKPTSSPTVRESHASSSSTLPTSTSSSVVATPSSSKDPATDAPSAGAKAGIAFGVLGGVMLVSLIVFLIFKRRKRQVQRQSLDDDSEKLHGGLGGDSLARMPSRSGPHAPRISLRPVTQFLPNWNLDKTMQKGATANLAPASASQWDRPSTSQSNHPNNPFGSGAERINTPNGPDVIAGQNTPAHDPWAANGPAIAAGAVAGAGAATLTRKTSMRKDSQKNYDLTVPGVLDTVPPSPVGTEFSISSMPAGAPNPQSSGAAAIAAAGGPSSSTVHRVQLDFKPTLEDEMELRAGDLVRLLHEYDDGWALCIRLDRSKQGVVPRTCLSTRPVKPRPPQGAPRPGPPINPQGGFPRGPNQPGRPMTPQGRPMTPQGRPMTPQGRPMTPQGQYQPQGMGPRNGPPGGGPGPRPQSPGPNFQGPPDGRPQSPNGMNTRPRAPSGPSPMNPTPQSPNQAPQRKPVPGQAY